MNIGAEVKDILQLSRWGNLVFLLVLQAVAFFFIYYFDASAALGLLPYLPLLISSTILIAAGGYLINDYFDIAIDTVNKPRRALLIKELGKHRLIKWHIFFTVLGLVLAIITAYQMGKLRLIGFQVFSIICLFLYSFVLKKKLLLGNLIISILSVTSFILLPIYAYKSILYIHLASMMPPSLLYLFEAVCVFTFALTFIREIIKDCEDVIGDVKHDCKTLPIVIGTHRSNYVIIVLCVVSMILYYHFYSILLHSGILCSIAFLLFEVFMLILCVNIFKAKTSKDYAQASNFVKLLMAYGLFTSILLLFYV